MASVRWPLNSHLYKESAQLRQSGPVEVSADDLVHQLGVPLGCSEPTVQRRHRIVGREVLRKVAPQIVTLSGYRGPVKDYIQTVHDCEHQLGLQSVINV